MSSVNVNGAFLKLAAFGVCDHNVSKYSNVDDVLATHFVTHLMTQKLEVQFPFGSLDALKKLWLEIEFDNPHPDNYKDIFCVIEKITIETTCNHKVLDSIPSELLKSLSFLYPDKFKSIPSKSYKKLLLPIPFIEDLPNCGLVCETIIVKVELNHSYLSNAKCPARLKQSPLKKYQQDKKLCYHECPIW